MNYFEYILGSIYCFCSHYACLLFYRVTLDLIPIPKARRIPSLVEAVTVRALLLTKILQCNCLAVRSG